MKLRLLVLLSALSTNLSVIFPSAALLPAPSLEEQLLDAATKGDAERVSALVAIPGININARFFDIDITPLHRAAHQGHTAVVKILLAAGAESSPQNSDSQATPLFYAACHRDAATVQALIDGGADVNTQDNQQATPLMVSAQRGYLEIVKIILQAPDVDPTIRDSKGFTADQLTKDRRIAALIRAKIAEYKAATVEGSAV